MPANRYRARSCARSSTRTFALSAVIAVAVPWATIHAQTADKPTVSAATPQGTPTYSIDWHVITGAGLIHARNSCFDLSGTAGQPAPGYSSGGSYQVISGFWTIAPTSGLDEIFFNGFEVCGS